MKKIMFGNSLMLLGIAIMILAGLKVIYVGTLWVSFLLIIVGFVMAKAVQRAVQFHPAPRVQRRTPPLCGHEPGDHPSGTPAQRHCTCAVWRQHAAGARGRGGQDL